MANRSQNPAASDMNAIFRLLEILPESDSERLCRRVTCHNLIAILSSRHCNPHRVTHYFTQATGRWYQSGLDFSEKQYTLQWSAAMACTESVRCSVATLLGGSLGILVDELSIHPSERFTWLHRSFAGLG